AHGVACPSTQDGSCETSARRADGPVEGVLGTARFLLAQRDPLVHRGLDVTPCGALRGPARLAELDAVDVHAGAGRGDPVGAGLLDRDALFRQDGAGVAAVGGHPVQLVPVRVVETEGAVLVAAAGLSVNG